VTFECGPAGNRIETLGENTRELPKHIRSIAPQPSREPGFAHTRMRESCANLLDWFQWLIHLLEAMRVRAWNTRRMFG
jgi:hypothetical protein